MVVVVVVTLLVCRQRYNPAFLASVHMGERQIEGRDQPVQNVKARPLILQMNQRDTAEQIVEAGKEAFKW